MAQHDATLSAPLWFYDEVEKDNVSAAEFLTETKAWIAGSAAITTDAQRIEYVVGRLRGRARQWWTMLHWMDPDSDV